MTSTKLKNRWPLLLLLVVQACVLFYNYTGIPFYHDELSAIERCKFDGFMDLIRNGVMVDGHPAGVHLFLWSLIQIFGIHEWILKLPFVLAGIGSLFFLYRISETIFSKYAAIASGILFIFLAYYISQMIVVRPYSPGLFFALGTFYFAFRLKYAPYNKMRHVLLGLFTVGAMYSHYFSFLQVILIWIIVFAFNRHRLYMRYYLLTFAGSIVCFLPHAFITYTQLGMGGLGWLGPPEPSFFIGFFFEYFNSSLIITVLCSALFILTFFVKKPRKKNKLSLLLLFALPCLVIYFYSVTFAPVLQAPALYFCTPFLLIFIGCGVDIFGKRKLIKILVLLLIAGCSMYGFLLEKQYYILRDYQPIEKFVINGGNFEKKSPDSKILFIWKGNSNYIGYYLRKHHFEGRIIVTDTLRNMGHIDLSAYDELVCNQLDPEHFRAIQTVFPYVHSVENNLLFTSMVLSKKKTEQPFYSYLDTLSFQFDTTKEWSQKAVTYKVNKLVPDLYRYIEFRPQLDSVIKGAELVLETYSHGNRIDWRSVYLEPGNILSIKLKDVLQELSPDLTFRLYIWNNTKRASGPIKVMVYHRLDNPLEYNFNPEGISLQYQYIQ